MGLVVNARLRPFYPLERPGTRCLGGWVGPRAGLDRCGKILTISIGVNFVCYLRVKFAFVLSLIPKEFLYLFLLPEVVKPAETCCNKY
jgi:hypothetical protein